MRAPSFIHPSLHATGALLLAVAFLAACGGGGGGGGGGDDASAQATSTGTSGGSSGSAFIPTGNGIDGESAFAQTVYPLTSQYCTGCHAGAGPGFPHLAHPDQGTAYRAVIDNQKANFANPDASRLVLRLSVDQHYCWSSCAADGQTMATAITDWANLIGYTGAAGGNGNTGNGGGQVAGVAASYSNVFANATAAESQRDQSNLIALYTFKEESGDSTLDVSGVPPSMHLDLSGGYTWLPGGGLEMSGGRAVATSTDSQKLFNRIASGRGSQEYSIEAWVIPANTDQEGPARIVTYSDDTQNRNFTLGQVQYTYVFRNRSSNPAVSPNGTPELQTSDDDEDLQATLQHVVATYDQVNGRRIYVNGIYTDDADAVAPDMMLNWNPGYQFALGNEVSGNRRWFGQLKLVAVYDRALPESQIAQNYLAGASDKFILRFGLDDYLTAGDFIEFEVSDFDAYSYLFCFPTVHSAMGGSFGIEGLRVAVNGTAPVASQSFKNVDSMVTQPVELLSGLCSVVPKDLGVALDQFSIWFDLIASTDLRAPEDPPEPIVDNSVLDPLPLTGIRDFDQINNTLAEITGVDPNTSSVLLTFDAVREQLPMNTDVRSFVTAQQVGIAKLALEYCNELVESPTLRTAFFGPFVFDRDAVTAFTAQADRDLIINALIPHGIGQGLANQPTAAEIASVLEMLIDDLIAGCTPATCPAERTRTVVKGACAAVLGSAAVHLQ